MDIVITQWALDSYLNLKHQTVFSSEDYRNIIRPDVLLLLQYNSPKFKQSNFWSAANGRSGPITNGYKMKWHNLGPSSIQLRLPVAILNNTSYLCEAYVKDSPQFDQRMMARFSVHLDLIKKGNFIERGRIT